ncbi:Platelet endothelial aggregation receptor 1 [Eumeta japonica]|uniref:Platelet endothelial aggregation receptor 1 n=1 Tax=Eumeta variegata TaxID=151549 RepID=A0A4C1WRT9_EUMVA|nr:Platelet endothelial aggregation receptor 1 [Eumeta japonica]
MSSDWTSEIPPQNMKREYKWFLTRWAAGTVCSRLSRVKNLHRTCPEGKWGRNCQNSCTCLNGGTCEPLTGQCACTPGWRREACEKPCAPGSFGDGCLEACNCQNSATCDGASGACTCLSGYKGPLCEEKCIDGQPCVQTCRCQNGEECNVVTGECKCTAGWTGQVCANCTQVKAKKDYAVVFFIEARLYSEVPSNWLFHTLESARKAAEDSQYSSALKTCRQGQRRRKVILPVEALNIYKKKDLPYNSSSDKDDVHMGTEKLDSCVHLLGKFITEVRDLKQRCTSNNTGNYGVESAISAEVDTHLKLDTRDEHPSAPQAGGENRNYLPIS